MLQVEMSRICYKCFEIIIVADGDDAVDNNAGLSAFLGDLAEELPQRVGTIRNEPVVLDVLFS